MSKLVEKYNKLKLDNPNKLYLFKNGKFYIFLCEDVDYINEFLVLKKTLFTKDKYKCGFPESSLNDYLRVFQNHNLDIEIIDDRKDKSDVKLILKSIDINNMTPIEALLKLKELKELVDD